jgi:SNF2 family DNA or RNA helicase
MNVEAFSTKKGLDFAAKFLRTHKTIMAVDESTTIKTPSAKRTKAIVNLGKNASYRRILTGSPVTKSPLDLFTQCEFLSEDLLGHSSFYSFRNRYAQMIERNFGGRRVQIVASYQRLDELAQILDKFSYRVLKEDCLDLPDKIYIRREIELTEEQEAAYATMKSAALAAIKGKLATAPHVLTQLMRLHQITCGHLKTDEGDITELKSNRINELMDVLEEVEGKAIIWANYIYDIKHIVSCIKKKYGDDSVVQYYGEVDSEQRQKNIVKFQDPESNCKFFVGNPQTGGYGLTLTSAATMIYFNNNYNFEYREQSEARIHRIGQKLICNYIDLICKDTIDEKVISILGGKIKLSAKILGEQAREWL